MKLSKQEGIKIQFHANVGGVQIKQSDWLEKDPNDIAYIKNAPDVILSQVINNVTDILEG